MSDQPVRYFYTLDYMLENVAEWKQEMWWRYQENVENPWLYKCWQDLYSLEIGLRRAMEKDPTLDESSKDGA